MKSIHMRIASVATTLALGVGFASIAAAATPLITDVAANAGTSTATVTWTTDIASDSLVNYGTTASYGSIASSSGASTAHSVLLTDLTEDTTYHFNVGSAEGTSTAATSSDMTFTTDVTATTSTSTDDGELAVTSVDAVDSEALADNDFADGWKWVMHFTVPTTEDAFRIRFSDWGMGSQSFPADGNMRLSSPQASNASTTENGMILADNDYSDWFYFTGDTSSTTAGRQIDLTVEVKVPFGTEAGAYSSNFTAQSWASNATSSATQ